MIWLTNLCFLAHVALSIQHRDVYASNITWEPTKIPLVFGKDVGIRCTYHNTLPCNDPISWTWYTGTNNDLILTNGTLTEEFKSENKYSEITSACLKVSTLIVSNFNENDYNQKYTCGIANHKQSGHLFAENIKSKITFAKTPYEYMPSDEMISTEIKLLSNQKISVRAEIDRVYPLPDCKATFKDKDYTSWLRIQKKKKSLFYSVSIDFTLYRASSLLSVGDMCIKCKGTGRWWYLTNSWNQYCTDKPTTDESGISLTVCLEVLCLSYFVSSMVAVIYVFYTRKEKFDMGMKKLRIVDVIHSVGATFILLGYTVPVMNADKGRFPQQFQYGYVLYIIQKIGAFKLIAVLVVLIITVLASKKTYKKKVGKNDYPAEYLMFWFYLIVTCLSFLLLTKEGKDGSLETISSLLDLQFLHLFIPIRIICSFMLRRLHNTEDTEDKVGNNKTETYEFLMDNNDDDDDDADDESFKRSEEKTLLMNTKLDIKSFGSSETRLMVDIENNDPLVGSTETHVPLVVKEKDAESVGSSETRFLEDIENDQTSVGSSETLVPLMVKEKDAESVGSSGSYNSAFESLSDEEMCFAESKF